MNTLTYDNFFEIARNLPPSDLLSLCSTNREYYGFCHRPNFYHDLILSKYGLNLGNLNYRDYRFVDELKRIKLQQPDRGISTLYPNLDYSYIVKASQELFDSYVKKELQAYLSGRRIRYFTASQSKTKESPELAGVWFSACTPEGAMLKFKDLYKPEFTLGDYFTYFFINSPQRFLLQDILILRNGKDIYDEDPLRRAVLIETRRPYLDLDPDGSKLDEAYEDIIDITRKYRVPEYLKNLYHKSEDEPKEVVIDGISQYYDEENQAIDLGVMRYFVIPIKFFYYEDEQDYYVPPDMTGRVIVAGSPEGALIRLLGPLRSLIPSVIDELIIYYNYELHGESQGEWIDKLVANYNNPDSQGIYLIEINRPEIV